RLNRAYPGKDTTYVLDFVNSSEEVLAAFKTYYDTAELEGVTDPNIVYDLRAKLDASGYYDEFEVDRVVTVEMNPRAKQGDLISALEPVVDRLLKRFKQAQEKVLTARAKKDDKGAEEANGEVNALVLFKADMGAFQRMYSFLSQIFDYGNTAIEKRFMFYRRLIPLLEFGRERAGIDLSKVKLTHHSLKDQGRRQLPLGDGEVPKLPPLSEVGSGGLHEKEKARLEEIIAKVNDLFEGDLTDDDQLVYVNNVIKGKLLECQELVLQASNNTKAQFANSPTLSKEIMNAVMDALAAHTAMSKQAIDSERIREGLKDVLLGPAQLYEALRERAGEQEVEHG
ncbi:MAG: type I restriction endonuclease subunit R, partial [Bradyrhizobium sp.]